jgi:DNA polymerase-1
MAKVKFEGIRESNKSEKKPYAAGISRDLDGKFIGKYVYLEGEQDQEKLYKLLDSFLKTYESNKNFYLTCDLETQSLDYINNQILLISVSWNGSNAVVWSPYFLWGKKDSTGSDASYFKWLEVLETIPINNQATKFDAKFLLAKYGKRINIGFDTLTACQLGWAGTWPGKLFNLGNISKNLLPYNLDKELQTSFVGQPVEQEFTNEQISYAAVDTMAVHKLPEIIQKRFKNTGLDWVWEHEDLPMLNSLLKSEFRGIYMDTPLLESIREEQLNKIHSINTELQDIFDNLDPAIKPKEVKNGLFNANSPKQKVAFLNAVGIKVKGTGVEVLEEVRVNYPHRVIDLFIEHANIYTRYIKTINKMLDEEINPTTNCFHTNYFPNGAASTGRLSSSPNSQNKPPQVRNAFIARPGYSLITADYSQFEFRACAGLVQEEYLLSVFVERAKVIDEARSISLKYGYIDPDACVKDLNKGKIQVAPGDKEFLIHFGTLDIHKMNAALIFNKNVKDVTDEERKISKQLGYALLYGSGEGTILQQLLGEGITHISLREVGEHKKTFYKELPKVENFIKSVHESVTRPGYVVNTLGRKRWFALPPKYKTSMYEKALADARREAVNWHFQSSNADALKLAIPLMDEVFEERFDMEFSLNFIKEHPIEFPTKHDENYFNIFGLAPVVLLNVHDEVCVEAKDEIVEDTTKIVIDTLVESGSRAINHTCPIECSLVVGPCWSK